MLSIYSACQAENPTRNHFGLTGVWSRVRSHMGSAYFSLPSAWAQPNMHKAQCRGHPVCAPGTSPGMHGGIERLVLSLEKGNTDGWGRAEAAQQHLRVHLVAGMYGEPPSGAQEVSPGVGKQLHQQLLRS